MPQIYIFSDFDGTITLNDLGDAVFQQFGSIDHYLAQLFAKEISISRYWNLLCQMFPDGTTANTIQTFALEQQTDRYFSEFVGFCRSNSISLTILSDGFDAYITPVLEREDAGDIPRFCNQIIFPESGKSFPVFPFADESCGCFCASCKRNSLLKNLPADAIAIYIGDGFSDQCAAEHCDIIFAKKNLAAYCNEHRIPHYPFRTFFDILRILRKLIKENNIRPRHQAVLKRKEAFETE